MPAKVEISASEVIVAPGSEEVIEARLRNLGAATETFSVSSAGPTQGWTVVDPPLVTLFPGAEQTLRVSLRPPRSAAITAGETNFAVRVVPHGDPDDVTTADAVVRVLAFDDRKLSFVQPVARGRERAVFDLVIENDGNTRAACRLALVDPANRVGARFEPPSVAVEAGGREVVRCRISARRPHLAGQPLPHLITAKATEEGHATAQATATFLQAALIPERLGRRFISLSALVATLALVWFAVLKPAVDRAADKAALKAATEQVAVLKQELGQSSATSTTIEGEPSQLPATEGRPWDRQWSLSAALGETMQTDPVTIDQGRVLRLTDIFWSNPTQDSGTLTLLRDGQVLAQWALGSSRNFPQALRNGFLVEAGSNVAVQLVCQLPGDPTATACNVSFTLGGSEAAASS